MIQICGHSCGTVNQIPQRQKPSLTETRLDWDSLGTSKRPATVPPPPPHISLLLPSFCSAHNLLSFLFLPSPTSHSPFLWLLIDLSIPLFLLLSLLSGPQIALQTGLGVALCLFCTVIIALKQENSIWSLVTQTPGLLSSSQLKVGVYIQ